MSDRSDFNDLAGESGVAVVNAIIARAAQSAPSREQRAAAVAGKYTEDSLADMIERSYEGKWLYSHMRGAWYIRDEATGQYEEDRQERVLHLIREFLSGLNSDNNAKLGSAATIAAVEKLARRSPALAIIGAELDANPRLLGTPAGVFDLETGERIQNIGDAFITKRTAVAPASGKPALWLQFIEWVTGGDGEFAGYLQRLCGYGLTGETREESLTFFHGPGGNGKGVFLGVLKDVSGDYGRQASTEALMESKGERHPADLADLALARLVIASESSDGKRWDEQRVKALTGRDEISARFMRSNFFTFKPQFKILVASNHKPRIRTVDDAWRRRLHLIPFDRKPERPDPLLKDRLKDEYPQILQWMIDGAEWWYREGLTTPAIITEATDEYFREEDLIGLWVDESVDMLPGLTGDRRLLYASYERWCKDMGHGAATIYAMTRWFKSRGCEQDTSKKTRPIIGATLKSVDGGLSLNGQ